MLYNNSHAFFVNYLYINLKNTHFDNILIKCCIIADINIYHFKQNKRTMKSKILSIFALAAGLLLFTNTSQAQGFYSQSYKERNSGSFEKGASLITLDYGLGNANWAVGLINGYSRVPIGPVYLRYEIGIMDEVGIGAYIAPRYVRYNYGQNHIYNLNEFTFGSGVMGYYHFNKLIPVSKLDVFAGTGFSFRVIQKNWPNDSSSNNNTSIKWNLPVKVGARWYFSDGFGAHLETGYDGLTYLQAGITLKF